MGRNFGLLPIAVWESPWKQTFQPWLSHQQRPQPLLTPQGKLTWRPEPDPPS